MGIGRTSLVLAGMLGGIVTGMGVVVLCFGQPANENRLRGTVRREYSPVDDHVSTTYGTSPPPSSDWSNHPRVAKVRGALSQAMAKVRVGE